MLGVQRMESWGLRVRVPAEDLVFRDLSSPNTRLSCVQEQGSGQCIFRDRV